MTPCDIWADLLITPKKEASTQYGLPDSGDYRVMDVFDGMS
jgi:hypothetical protein